MQRGSKGLGSLFSDVFSFAWCLYGILAFSLTDIFDTISALIGTGEKVEVSLLLE